MGSCDERVYRHSQPFITRPAAPHILLSLVNVMQEHCIPSLPWIAPLTLALHGANVS